MQLNDKKLKTLAREEKLINKYLVEVFYDDEDFEGYWQELARFCNATDVLSFLECDLVEGLDANLISHIRVLDVETDESIYTAEYRKPSLKFWPISFKEGASAYA